MYTRFNWILLSLAISLLGLAWIGQSREAVVVADYSNLVAAPQAGYLAPDFSLTTLQAEEITLSDYRGRPVILNFWATWCPPCRAEIPFFQQSQLKYNGRAIILGIDQAEPLSLVAPFVADLGMTYPILLDLESAVSDSYGVVALPTTFFIDSNGVVQKVHPGIISQGVLEDEIEQLLEGQ